jgi:membrane protein DedA with SNARE-associated domain
MLNFKILLGYGGSSGCFVLSAVWGSYLCSMSNDRSVWSELICFIIWSVITAYIIYFFNFQFTSDANLLVRVGGLFFTVVLGHLPFISAMNCLGKILREASNRKYGDSKFFRYMETMK